MIKRIIALGFIALGPQAQAQPDLLVAQRPSLLQTEKPMSCADIEAALARLLPAANDERGRLQALYRSQGCLDPAFTRRLNKTMAIPAPDGAARKEIWRQSIPPDTTPPPDPPAKSQGSATLPHLP